MQSQTHKWKFLSIAMISITLCTSAHATGSKRTQIDGIQSDSTYVQSAIECAKSCAAPLVGAITSGAGFLAYTAGVSCASGVCPLVVTTGASGLLTVSGLGAALSTYIVSAGEVCAEGYASLECAGYVAVPVIMGGIGGYLIVKGYDKARNWYLQQQRRQAQGLSEQEPQMDVAEFVPDESVSRIQN